MGSLLEQVLSLDYWSIHQYWARCWIGIL